LTFTYKVLTKYSANDLEKPPEDGAYIYGLFLDGAKWDVQSGLLTESSLGELWSPMPLIYFLPTQNATPSSKDYTCPIYKTSKREGVLSSTGQSTNFVVDCQLPTNKDPSHWVLMGAALLCQLDS
jgi:dynein heavy chain